MNVRGILLTCVGGI